LDPSRGVLGFARAGAGTLEELGGTLEVARLAQQGGNSELALDLLAEAETQASHDLGLAETKEMRERGLPAALGLVGGRGRADEVEVVGGEIEGRLQRGARLLIAGRGQGER